MLVKRTIKNQVQEYEYKGREIKYDTRINIRVSTKDRAKLKALADSLNYKDISPYIRTLIEQELEKHDFIETTDVNGVKKYVMGVEKNEL